MVTATAIGGTAAAREMVERARADLVRRYLAQPSAFPDGIGAWYRPEDWVIEGDVAVRAGETREDREIETRRETRDGETPWEAAGMSRATWYRKQANEDAR